MVNANRKGREAENRLSTWFTVHGYPNELIRLQGVNDAGDLWLPYEYSRIELKNHANMLSGINEAIHDVEKLDVKFPGDTNYAVVVRPGKPPEEWYAIRKLVSVWPKR